MFWKKKKAEPDADKMRREVQRMYDCARKTLAREKREWNNLPAFGTMGHCPKCTGKDFDLHIRNLSHLTGEMIVERHEIVKVALVESHCIVRECKTCRHSRRERTADNERPRLTFSNQMMTLMAKYGVGGPMRDDE